MGKCKHVSKYDEMLEKYLQEGINWDAYKNEVIKTANKSELAKGDVEQFAADSYWQGWQDAKSENGKLPIPLFIGSLPEAFGEWILMCCYEPNGLDGWIRWYDVGYEGEKDERIYTTKELFEQFKDFIEKWGDGNDCLQRNINKKS